MTYTYANSCRAARHSEGHESLLTSRGRVMGESWKAQSFNQAANDPQEVPSTV
jgi:hypothetical protein